MKKLSPSNEMILLLFAEGLDRNQVAQKLGLTVRALDNHIKTIKSNLHANTMCQAVANYFRKKVGEMYLR